MVKLTVKKLPKERYGLKASNPMTAKGYTVHNTYNDASALNEISYMQRNDSSTSFTYAVDKDGVVQGLPLDRNGWHAGDGSNGYGNRNTWGVEICYSKSGGERYDKAEDVAIKFIAQGLYDNNWDITKVWKHQDWSGKNCPHRILDRSRGWGGFIEEIQKELDKLNGVKSEKTPGGKKQKRDISKVGVDTLAREVIDGKWGVGADRERRLGDRYKAVQKRVNQILKENKVKKDPLKTKGVEALAREVIDGKWGVGADRERRLGNRYKAVQKRVNQILSSTRRPKKSLDTLIDEVNRGLHGDGEARKKSLGSDYRRVQNEINRRARR